MYQQYINTSDQALVHLAFHCCLKDGKIQETELDFLSGTFAAKGLNKLFDFKEEMANYRSYFTEMKDETNYLNFLIEKINPRSHMALFAFCAEIICRDGNISISEEVLLNKTANLLHIKDAENLTIQKLITEMNAVEKRNAF